MTSRLTNLVINALDPVGLADFWCAALGWRMIEQDEDLVTIGDPDGTWPLIDLVAVRAVPAGAHRLHLDLRAAGTSQEAEVERLLALGARHADVGQGDDVTWVVMADPEGNEFCVLERSVADVLAAGGGG